MAKKVFFFFGKETKNWTKRPYRTKILAKTAIWPYCRLFLAAAHFLKEEAESNQSPLKNLEELKYLARTCIFRAHRKRHCSP